ncbi:MAG TPA: hypothetical protein VG755_27775 [Nannocystaceae bacterium]|nr:hypothetical protein [Nannocystaceae bacterium]
MKRVAIMGLACACGPQVPLGDGESSDGGGTSSSASTSSSSTTTIADTSSEAGDEDTPKTDVYLPPPTSGDLDVLFVVDNSAGMADIQLWLGQAMPSFVASLSATPRSVQVMVTTTDVGNPLCTRFQKPDYTPARGAPIATGCNERINRFTGLDPNDPEVREDVCSSLCPVDVEPSDPFVAFDTATGEANAESAEAALACLIPQGVDGCGYEAPLEAMWLALDPNAEWNVGARPFLRDGADLAVVIVSNESDCSMEDLAAMTDEQWWNVNPHSGSAQPSSALCWNAGVECTGPDAEGVYDECWPREGPMFAVSRYRDRLDEQAATGKRVFMVALTGLPIDGGPLVYRQWRDDDLSSEEVMSGVEVEDLTWELGIGPACSFEGDDGEPARALPSPRVLDTCGGLDGIGAQRCCVGSVCAQPDAALSCLVEIAAP